MISSVFTSYISHLTSVNIAIPSSILAPRPILLRPYPSQLLPTVACPPCALAVSFPGRLRWQGEATPAVCHGVILRAETVQLICWHWLVCWGGWKGGRLAGIYNVYVCAFGGELPGVSLARWQVWWRRGERLRRQRERNTGLDSVTHPNTHQDLFSQSWRTMNRVSDLWITSGNTPS